jgi:hypothetical protein
MTRRRAAPQGSELRSVEAERLRRARLGVWESEGGGLGPRGAGEWSPGLEGLGQDGEQVGRSPRIARERFSWERDAVVSALVTERRATA